VDYRTRGNYGTLANRRTGKDDRSRGYPCPIADHGAVISARERGQVRIVVGSQEEHLRRDIHECAYVKWPSSVQSGPSINDRVGAHRNASLCRQSNAALQNGA
jgi:hypothetical protein